jgi:type III secretory pathway component EscR
METIGIVFPAIMMVGLGIAIGMYVSSQIKCHISRRINNKELLKNLEDEQEKRKD